MIKKIITVPNPLLRQKSKMVGKIDQKTKKIISDLLATVKGASDPEGLGLSAIQISQPVRIFVAKTGKDFEIFINPQIIEASEKKLSQVLPKSKQFFEGCLSLPEIYGFVDRPYKIKLSWQDEKNQKKTRVFTNKIGICLQHELDHLDGILFTDWLLKQKGKIYELKKDDQGQEIFEEME